MSSRVATIAVLLAMTAAGCDCRDSRAGGRNSDPRGVLDSGVLVCRDGCDDAGTSDGGDGGDGIDAGDGIDGGAIDGGGTDAGGNGQDGGASDGGSGPDAGIVDAGAIDSGVPRDGGVLPRDGGVLPRDGGVLPRDGGVLPRDAGPPPGSGDIWIEINYANANTSRSPAFSYSVSPGWTAASWDFNGSTGSPGAEAWDRFNNMQVVNDPIGRSLEIGGSSQLQLMLGLVPLISYTGATVELEGRSRATSSPVFFDVTNPLNGCGGSATMNQDWTPDIVHVSLSGCFVVGGAVQAVRVDPTSGTIALRRMRLTLHGARW